MMSATELRPMCFALRRVRPLGDSGGKSRCRWTVYSYPDLALLCDDRIIGDLEDAEGMARIAITAMGGTLELREKPDRTEDDRASGEDHGSLWAFVEQHEA